MGRSWQGVARPAARQRGWSTALGAGVLAVLAVTAPTSWASDHADPIDILRRGSLEAGITDLFVFPVDKDDQPVAPYADVNKLQLHGKLAEKARQEISAEDLAKIDSFIVILCVRRALTDEGTLHLQPFTYRVHFDTHSAFEQVQEVPDEDKPVEESYNRPKNDHDHDHAAGDHEHPPAAPGGAGYAGDAAPPKVKRPTKHEAFLRYGGWIPEPEKIKEDFTLEFRLKNDTEFQDGYPKYLAGKGAPIAAWQNSDRIKVVSGVFDDPFIFPAFFGTNIVGIAIKIPKELFPADRRDFLIWATSHEGTRQIDHVGRSLRTQNPRFELLNTLHPSLHAKAIQEAHEHPGLMRDLALRLNFAQEFAYRTWDFVPDVMVMSTRHQIGFPNGRLINDDVAAALAQYGDTLLYELSYQHNNSRWPRQRANDVSHGEFDKKFPYLLPAQEDRAPVVPPDLTAATKWKLFGILAAIVLGLMLENWLVAWLYYRWKNRPVHL